MKIHEILEELKEFDPNTDVVFGTPNLCYWDIEKIEGPDVFQIEGVRTKNSSGWEKYPVILTLWKEINDE